MTINEQPNNLTKFFILVKSNQFLSFFSLLFFEIKNLKSFCQVKFTPFQITNLSKSHINNKKQNNQNEIYFYHRCLHRSENKKKREGWLEYNIADQLHYALVHVRLHNDSEVTSPI